MNKKLEVGSMLDFSAELTWNCRAAVRNELSPGPA